MWSTDKSDSGGDTAPSLPPDSPGSSVSIRLQEEYAELLKNALILPNLNALRCQPAVFDSDSNQPSGSSKPIIATTAGKARARTGETEEQEIDADVLRIHRICEPVAHSTTLHSAQSPFRQDAIKTSTVTSKPTMGRGQLLRDLSDSSQESTHMPYMQSEEDDGDPLSQHRQDRLSSKNTAPRQSTIPKPGIRMMTSQGDRSAEFEVLNVVTIDPDVFKMERLMEQWCSELKKNVLAEFSDAKIHLIEIGKQQLHQEKEKHVGEQDKLYREIDQLKEILHTYETTISRKDGVIDNLTQALNKQKDRCEMMRRFADWKIKHNDSRRETFASTLARRHYDNTMAKKVWRGWHSIIESKWHHRVEKACQAKAQEVCIQLTNDYETKFASLNEALEAARQEVSRLHAERDRYEETMKKAFMRGVCALNMEAMSMFHGAEDGAPDSESGQSHTHQPSPRFTENGDGIHPSGLGQPMVIGQEALYTEMAHRPASPRVVTSLGGVTAGVPPGAHQVTSRHPSVLKTTTTAASGKPRTFTAKISSRKETATTTVRASSGIGMRSHSPTLAPPMSSVVVERHQPIAKQTLGHATAAHYPKASRGVSHHHAIAGQTTPVTLAMPNIQSVKIVD